MVGVGEVSLKMQVGVGAESPHRLLHLLEAGTFEKPCPHVSYGLQDFDDDMYSNNTFD